MASALSVSDLIRYAVARSLFPPTTLARAVEQLGFVQADPIRAPARAQDLTLRPRVKDYRAGDLERRYHELDIEEDYFVNYGFLPHAHHALMHPRVARRVWDKKTRARAAAILEFVKDRGEVHPREVEATFSHGRITNYWGGSSNASTHLLDGMHYRGMLRVVRRDAGIRIYAPAALAELDVSPRERAKALLALAAGKYAPVPARTLADLASRLRYGAPQLMREVRAELAEAKRSWPRATIEGIDWYWPEGEDPRAKAFTQTRSVALSERAWLLAPFDPIVWDRRRFELFWGWAYRFEAYTPAKKRKLGYYALPLLWRNRVIGWGNLALADGALHADIGYVSGAAPKDRAFDRALEAELERMRSFLTKSRSS